MFGFLTQIDLLKRNTQNGVFEFYNRYNTIIELRITYQTKID